MKSNWRYDGAGQKLLSHMGMSSGRRGKLNVAGRHLVAAVCCGLPLIDSGIIESADQGIGAGRKLLWQLQNEVAVKQDFLEVIAKVALVQRSS